MNARKYVPSHKTQKGLKIVVSRRRPHRPLLRKVTNFDQNFFEVHGPSPASHKRRKHNTWPWETFVPSFFNGLWCLYTVFKKKSPKTTPKRLKLNLWILYQLLTSSPDDDASIDSQCLARWHKSLEVDPNKRVTSAMDPRSSLRNGQVLSSRFLSIPFHKKTRMDPRNVEI